MSKFNKERLIEARIYKRMTMEELAQKTNLTKQTISLYENSKAVPEFDNLLSISKTLEFPLDFFVENEVVETKVGNTFFRALYSSSKKDLEAQKIKAKYVVQLYSCLENYVEFQKTNTPLVMPNDIEQAALSVRDFWGLGQEPILDMVLLLEKSGIIVSEFSTNEEKIDAFSQYVEISDQGYYCVILGTDKNSAVRRQFDCAHELGHILLHERYDDSKDVDRALFRKREAEANEFAAALLMPRDAFIADVSKCPNKLNYYVELKKKWKVSVSAMIMRANSLGIINSNQYQYLMRQISINGWRTREPLDDLLIVNRPRALRQAISLLLLNGILTGRQIFNAFSDCGYTYPKEVVDEILGLEPDILTLDNKDIIMVPIAQLK